jgi:methionyl-tRNA formyltransferase
MHKTNSSILFLGKRNDDRVEKALKFCSENFSDFEAFLGDWDDPLPEKCQSWEGDYIVSYMSRWVVPEVILRKARITALNFHPAPPEYPGIGCSNFALYEHNREYGVTCHKMASRVDTGEIVAVRRFPLLPTDDIASLLSRTYDYQLVLFYEILSLLIVGKALPVSSEHWSRRPINRRELNELAKISVDMSREEIAARVRATTFGSWRPTVEIEGFVFELKTSKIEQKEP